MTKRKLVMEVASKLGFPQNEVSLVVQATLDEIIAALQDGQRLEIRNFGIFEARMRDARMGRNPRTGEDVPIAKKRIATFKPGRVLKEWVESGDGGRPGGLFAADGASTIDSGADRDAPLDAVYGMNFAPGSATSPAEADAAATEAEEDTSASAGEQQSLF